MPTEYSDLFAPFRQFEQKNEQTAKLSNLLINCGYNSL